MFPHGWRNVNLVDKKVEGLLGRRHENDGVLLDDVAEAAAVHRAHKKQAAESREKLYAAMRAAHREGISAAKIAKSAQMSRERVRQIVQQ